jgi:hypothetical protein
MVPFNVQKPKCLVLQTSKTDLIEMHSVSRNKRNSTGSTCSDTAKGTSMLYHILVGGVIEYKHQHVRCNSYKYLNKRPMHEYN